jgi:hypothetical protein
VPRGDFEQDFGGSGRLAPTLFPILQGVGTDPKQRGELALREAELQADASHLGPFLDLKNTSERATIGTQGTS